MLPILRSQLGTELFEGLKGQRVRLPSSIFQWEPVPQAFLRWSPPPSQSPAGSGRNSLNMALAGYRARVFQ